MNLKKTTRLLFLALCLAALPFQGYAERVTNWLLVTDAGRKYNMNDVDYLLSSDDTTEFIVALTNGDLILGVKKVTFTNDGGTGISISEKNGEISLYSVVVSSTLNLFNCEKGSVIKIISPTGAIVKSVVAEGGQTTIAVDDLASGYYLLNSGKSTIKFIKK